MLYQITDRFGKPVGVHECDPRALMAHLRSLPQQGAPYTIKAETPARLHPVHLRLRQGSIYQGLLLGLPFYSALWLTIYLLVLR